MRQSVSSPHHCHVSADIGREEQGRNHLRRMMAQLLFVQLSSVLLLNL